MSNRTNAALADAWLTADVALSRRIRKNELDDKQDEYDAMLTTIIEAQQDAIDAEDDWGFWTGILAAGTMIVDQWANITTGGLWGVAKGTALATTAYGAGQEVGRAGYQAYAGLYDLEDDIGELVDDLDTYDWMLSEKANKYNRAEGDDLIAALESNVDSQVGAYEDWANRFYNWEDHAINAGTRLIATETAGTAAFGTKY